MNIRKRLAFCAVLASLLSLTLHAQPVITTGGTVNAADYSRDFAPGAIVSIFGNSLASTSGGATSVPLPTTLGGTSVELVNGTSVQSLPLFYISPTQINAELPYGLPPGTVQIRVRAAGGVSAIDSIPIKPRAPKLFTVDLSGAGSAVVTDPGFTIATQARPVKPGDTIILWMNSLGETSPPVVAGNSAPGGPTSSPAVIADTVTVTIGGKTAPVTFVGAAPAYSGLYQVNVKAPFAIVTGPLNVQVSLGGVTTQAATTVPYRQLGFYDAVLGGKPVSGQPVNGLGALAFRQSDGATWGQTGFNQWTAPASPSPINSAVSGEAVTLKNAATTVFDNNGIEDASGVLFYSNVGGGPDNQKPGLVNLFSMSNYFSLIFSTYMKFTQPVTISEMIGYFDPNGNLQLPFDPNNPYIKYRMNIWSSANGMPKETGGFTGDVFSSDSTAGTFTLSRTGVNRISSNTTLAPDPIWRLDFKLNNPISLPAGEYWFSHDASVRDMPVAGNSISAWVTASELAGIIQAQPQSGKAVSFSFFGREMLYQPSWTLPFALEIRPESPISTKDFHQLEAANQ